jgi:hypothetical protein
MTGAACTRNRDLTSPGSGGIISAEPASREVSKTDAADLLHTHPVIIACLGPVPGGIYQK